MNEKHCQYCDPDFFYVFGKCTVCGKEVRPPLRSFDFNEEDTQKRIMTLHSHLKKAEEEYKEVNQYFCGKCHHNFNHCEAYHEHILPGPKFVPLCPNCNPK